MGPKTAFAALLLFYAHASFAATKVAPEIASRLLEEETATAIVLLADPAPFPELLGRTHPQMQARILAVQRAQDEVLASLGEGNFVVSRRLNVMPLIGGRVTRAGLVALVRHPKVVAVFEDRVLEGAMNESAPLIGARAAQAAGYTGNGVQVAVLDTGIATNHPDLQNAVIEELCLCQVNGVNCCPNGSNAQTGAGAAADDHGHGTNIAGIIASAGNASPRGIAPDADLLAFKVMNAQNTGSLLDLAAAVDYILDYRPNVDVINISMGWLTGNNTTFSGTCDNQDSWLQVFTTTFNNLRNAGVTVVVSSGNDYSWTGVRAPGCIASALTVGAVYDTNTGAPCNFCPGTRVTNAIACYSNASTALDLLAPGDLITATGRPPNMTSDFCGTSMAAPHVAGAAALLREAVPSMSPAQIEQTLRNTGLSINDGRNNTSYSRINVLAALNSAAPCRITVEQPNGGEIAMQGSQTWISWLRVGNSCAPTVRLELYRDGNFVRIIEQAANAQSTYNWTIPQDVTPGSGYTVRVIDNNNASVADGSNGTFTVTAAPCQIVIDSPITGHTVQPGKSYNVAWHTNGPCASTLQIDVMSGGSSVQLIAAAATTSAWIHPWTVPAGLAQGPYSIRLKPPDDNGTVTGNAFQVRDLTPSALSASMLTSTSVRVTWTVPSGAAHYQLWRKSSAQTAEEQVALMPGSYTFFDDTNLDPGKAYVYRLRSVDTGSGASGYSPYDLAVTLALADRPLAAQTTPVRAQHLMELLATVNATRALANLGAISLSAPSPATGQPIRAAHVNELRNAIGPARTSLGLSAIAFGAAVSSGTPIQAQHIETLRSAVD